MGAMLDGALDQMISLKKSFLDLVIQLQLLVAEWIAKPML